MAKTLSGWLTGEGEESMVVLSTRVRLARNVANLPYPAATDTETREKTINYFESARSRSKMLNDGNFLKAIDLDQLDRDFLIERHLMSPTFMHDNSARALYINATEQISIMINEEDHFRIQALSPGLNPSEAFKTASEYDAEIGKYIEYDYDSDYGFLTACPTNVGTGMRVSVLIHLPGLVITKDIDRVINRISQQGVDVRGFYGEGTDVLGNLFQISNHTTLGISEKQILELIGRIAKGIIEDEAAARDRLKEEAATQIEDKIWRAYGILKSARLLTAEEVMNLLSAVRLGAAMGIINNIKTATLNEILLLSQPAHLQKYYTREMDTDERDLIRASMVRDKLG